MRDPRGWWAPALLALGVLTGACGGDQPAPLPPVPDIENPKNVRGLDPCEVATPGALAEVGISGGGTSMQAEEGPRCTWVRPSGARLTVTLYTDGGGLATLAQNSEPTTSRVRVEGYPALETFTERGRFCQYDVAVAPQQVLMAALENATPDSCAALQALLPDLLTGLPAFRPGTPPS